MNYIVTVLLRMRTQIATVTGVYVMLRLSLTIYPVEPKVAIRPRLILLFFVIAAVVGTIYAGMHRDATLSRLTDTKPGELGGDFWVRIIEFVAVPLLSLMVAQFPDVYNAVFSWLGPAMQALNH